MRLCLLALLPAASGLRTIELVTGSGDTVIDSDTASCMACGLVMAHLQNQTKQELVKVTGGGGAMSSRPAIRLPSAWNRT